MHSHGVVVHFKTNDTRWENADNPLKEKIKHIGERVNSPNSMATFRSINDYNLLLDIINDVEECFNDNWLPFEMFGLTLNQTKTFLTALLGEFDQINEGEWTSTIKRIHQDIKTNS